MGKWLFVLLILAVVGCGSGENTARVTGTITYNGNPLEMGTIVLHPVTGRPAQGVVVNGSIQDVTTLEKGDGAILGEAKIAIQASKPDPSDPSGMSTVLIIPAKYGNSETSGISTVIKAGTNELKIELVD